MRTYELFRAGSTGTGRQYVRNMEHAKRLALDFEVSAVGATPSISFNVQGLVPGGDPEVSAHWVNLALGQADASVAVSNVAVTVTAVGRSFRYVAGLDSRFFESVAVNVTANTNVTFRAELKEV